MRISTLITSYNYEHYLEEAVHSALNQTVTPHEVIVVDDGSTDGSRKIIEKLAAEQPARVIPVFQENAGQAAAFNAAFAASTGDIIFFLDSDDTWYPDKTATVLPALEKTGFVQHNLLQNGKSYRSFTVASGHLRYMQSFGLFDFFVPTSGICFRREVLEHLFPLPEDPLLKICADAFITRLALYYSELETIPAPLGMYRVHGANYWYTKRHRFPKRIVEILELVNSFLETRHLPRIPLERNWFVHGLTTERTRESLALLESMQNDPEHAQPAAVLEGWLHLSLQRHDQALTAFQRAVNIPSSSAKQSAVGEDVQLLLSTEKEAASPDTSGLSPDDTADAHYNMAVCLVRLGRYEQALDAFEQVLRFAPDRLEIHLNRSDSLRYLGRYREALAETDLVAAKDPDFPGIEETRAKVRDAMSGNMPAVAGAPALHSGTGADAGRLNVQIQTTSRCNGKCIMCPYLDSWHKENPGEMSDAVFERILSELAPRPLDKVCLYFENEPLMDPKIFQRLARLKNALHFQRLEISTNAALLSRQKGEELARLLEGTRHEIWISFHGVDRESYEGIMGLDFERSLENVNQLLRLADRRGLKIVIRGSGMPMDPSLAHSSTFSREQFTAFWNARTQELGLSRRPPLNYFFYHDRSGSIRRNAIRLKKFPRPDLTGFRCQRIEGWLHFMYTGELSICCMDYHREHVLGNINTHSLDDILWGEPFNHVREMSYGLKTSPPDFICKRCISPNG